MKNLGAFTALADDTMNGQTFRIIAVVNKNGLSQEYYAPETQVSRTFFVTDTSSDSLGAAISQANASCADEYPCKVAFRLGTPPESGYFTFQPERPLPKVTGKNVSIDGTTQTRLTGDTNPNGPEIFIDGSRSTWEDAIVFDESCGAELAGVAIGNFANAAVTMNSVVDPDASRIPCISPIDYLRSVHDNYLGVDPSGTHAAPNGRGVVFSESLLASTTVTNNLISGNRRSGIWIGTGWGNTISGNTIGIDIHHQPLGNGASGIYVGPRASRVDIVGNYVAFNHDFGIAIDRRATSTQIEPNSIFANAQLGIDVGLDGPTADTDPVRAPVILSAHYDAASNRTVIVLSSNEPPAGSYGPRLTLYASDAPHASGYGDGQYLLGDFDFDSTKGNVTFAAAGDWRGKWVAATVTQIRYLGFAFIGTPAAEIPGTSSITSEFSRAVKVE